MRRSLNVVQLYVCVLCECEMLYDDDVHGDAAKTVLSQHIFLIML